MIVLMILLGFTLTIFVHELGHFLAARMVGVKVKTFAIGMGPKILRLYTDKKGTDYIIALLPIGGYVEMLGQEDIPKSNKKKTKKNTFEEGHYLSKTPLQRIFIVTAGVMMNLIFAYFLIVTAFKIGVPFTTNKVGGFMPSFPINNSGVQLRDQITHINDKKVETWEDILTEVAFIKDPSKEVVIGVKRFDKNLTFKTKLKKIDQNNDLPPQLGILPYSAAIIHQKKQPQKNGLSNSLVNQGEIIKAHIPSANLTKQTPYGIYQLIYNNPNKEVTLFVKKENEIIIQKTTIPAEKIFSKGYMLKAIIDVLPSGAAEKAGLQNGDEILSFNGKVIKGWEDLNESSKKIQSNKPIILSIKRESLITNLTLNPHFDPNKERYFLGISHSIAFKEKSNQISYLNPSLAKLGDGLRIGDQVLKTKIKETIIDFVIVRRGKPKIVSISKLILDLKEKGHLVKLKEENKTIRYSLGVSLYKGFGKTRDELKEVYTFLQRLLTGKLSVKMLGGPIRIFEVSYYVAENKGLAYFILLFAKIGISLAIVNMLPIPVVDGGHFIILLYELFRRKPIKQEILNVIHICGLVFLICLFVFVFYNDIRSLK